MWYSCPSFSQTQIQNGRFHTRGRRNRLDGQIVSDEQIFWCANGTNKFFDEQIVWYLSVWKDDFSLGDLPVETKYDINSHQTNKCQTICPSRRLVRPLVWKRPIKGCEDLWRFSSQPPYPDSLHTCLLCISFLCKQNSVPGLFFVAIYLLYHPSTWFHW